MADTAYLVLENGKYFKGTSFGYDGDVSGEIVFTTGMTGYIETLTDPSYYGQIVLQTFPLIGNYGVIREDFESGSIWARGYIVKEPCFTPSNFRSGCDINELLKEHKVPGLYGIDTRALTKQIREYGVMNGMITCQLPNELDIDAIKAYKIHDAVKSVSVKKREFHKTDGGKYTIAVMDFGYKKNILRELHGRGCSTWLFPSDSTAEEVLSVKPDGIMLTNGPGDPAENTEIIHCIKKLVASNTPIFGICLGHQLLALAHGFKTVKLRYGHRGANQPVKDLISDRVYISSQNHGYCVLSESIDKSVADEWFTNANDNTCEGVIYKNPAVRSVQFHPEACGGPLDTSFLFDEFLQTVGNIADDN